ncbi:MAG: succinate dehydrogenase assembly factor 2 [Pseudomonadota bacterium]
MEDPINRLKRLRIRSWRRGTKEMDLFFGRFADAHLDRLDSQALDDFEALLMQEDPHVMSWVTRQEPCPSEYRAMVDRLRTYAESLSP